MNAEEQLLDASSRMKFLQADAQRLHDIVVEQGYRTEEQDAEMDMMKTIGDEIAAEVGKLTAGILGKECRHCGKPVHRSAGLWVHTVSSDFAKCGKAGIPREGM
jgi:hypothetical protein